MTRTAMVEQRGQDNMEESQEPSSPTQEAQTQTKHTLSPMKRCCDKIVRGLETLFYWWGFYVGLWPKLVITISILVVGALSSGMIFFKEENMPEKLWLPTRSETAKNRPYIKQYFPTSQRYTQVVVVAPDVLEPSVIRGMYELDVKLKNSDKKIPWNYKRVCAKAGPMCWSNSILELWRFNKRVIYKLTKEDILETINTAKTSPVFFNEFDVTKILAKIKRDDNGTIIAAEATQLNYALKVNSSADAMDKILKRALLWEKYFLDVLAEKHEGIPKVYYYAMRSYDDEAKGGTYGDLYLLGVGYALMVIFISIVLGNFNTVEHRVYLGLAGIGAVAMALAVSLGVGCYTNVFYGPIHNVLAFLLLGLGVDDMFVIVQALDCVDRQVVAKQPVHVQVAHAMRSAGVSITVTSLTDILAFAVGTTTTIPSLWAFCVYCVIGIGATYLLQATFFVACLSLDQQRALAKRDACCFCCIKYEKIEKNKCSREGYLQIAFKKIIGPLITVTATKVTVILIAVGGLGFSIYGVIHLEQMTDLAWVFPDNSYARHYIYAQRDYFPDAGTRSMVYIGDIDNYRQLPVLEKLRHNLQEDWYIENGSVDCWFHAYRSWLNQPHIPLAKSQIDQDNFPSSEENFYGLLKVYIATKGRRFVQDIRFNDNFTRVIASRFSLKHTNMYNSHEEVRGMEHIQDITANSGLGPRKVVPYAGIPYITYEMNKVIKDELYRNIGLALICVAIMTFPLIADLQASLLVFMNVVLILVNVAGLMHLLGLTIDVVTSLILILAIGMSVDYAAHVGHTFMTLTGTRNERASRTLGRIGPAVFYGGFSTFLALSPLSFAKVYTLKTFFQVFAAIVFSGLFHGLLVLPAILSLIGPDPYPSANGNRTSMLEEFAVESLENENRRSMLLRADSQEECRIQENGPPAAGDGERSEGSPAVLLVSRSGPEDEAGVTDSSAPINSSRENEVLKKQNKMNGFSILSLL